MSPPLSPGLAQSAFELVAIVHQRVVSVGDARHSLGRLASFSASEALDVAEALEWVVADAAGFLQVTDTGRGLHGEPDYVCKLRRAIKDYVRVVRPPWLASASFGRARVLRFLNRQLQQVFSEAGLASDTDSAAVAFWDDLAHAARNDVAGTRMETGRLGERLTVQFEQHRTNRCPRWIAIDNSSAGYDVLSVYGETDEAPLLIEVKTSSASDSAIGHITRNEWTVAEEAERFVFHFWLLADDAPPSLACLDVAALSGHVPTDSGHGQWESVAIPFECFRDKFRPVAVVECETQGTV